MGGVNRDDVMRMAREAGLSITPPRAGEYDGGRVHGDVWALKRFALLVAAAERDECAQLCYRLAAEVYKYPTDCAAAIRARGKG